MIKRKIVDVSIDDYVDFYDVLDNKTPKQVIDVMQLYLKEYKDRDVYFNVDCYGYDGGKELKLRERRQENDKEFNQRLKEHEKETARQLKIKEKKEEKELAEYQRLKKKFEGAEK